MLVSITLTAAAVCTARNCTKRLDEMQWPETQDETYWAETETYCSETEMRPKMHRSKTKSKTLVRLETVSRLSCLDRDHIPYQYRYSTIASISEAHNSRD